MKKTVSLLCFCFLLTSVYAQKTLTDSAYVVAGDQTLTMADKARKITRMMVEVRSNTEEKLDVFYKIVLPLVKEIKKKNICNEQMAYAYINISALYNEHDDIERTKSSLDSAQVFALKSANDTIIATTYRRLGTWHQYFGNAEKGHEYAYKAINLFEKQGDYNAISACFLEIANTHAQMQDCNGLKNVIDRMQEFERQKVSKEFLYNMYQIQGVYYSMLYEASPDSTSYLDSTVVFMSRAIHIAENSRGQINAEIPIEWSYFNLAAIFLNNFNPPRLDSVSYYLNKIESVNFSKRHQRDVSELQISVNDVKAWLHYYRGEYAQAEKKILEALDLINRQTDQNMLIPERSEAYRFLAKLYEETGRTSLALKYQKLFNENQSERFKQEKMYAINELNTKYEVDKKVEHIEELKKEQEYSQRIFSLTILIIVVLSAAIILLGIAYRLRRKVMEQRLYELALVAEQRLEDLEHKEAEKERLAEEYTKLKEIATSSGHEAKYEEKLDLLNRNIHRSNSQVIASKVQKIINSSGLHEDVKRKYLTRLSEIDAQNLELTFTSLSDKLTTMDMKYIICFYIDMDISHISSIFNVEPASVYTVRYRIKKKVSNSAMLDFLV